MLLLIPAFIVYLTVIDPKIEIEFNEKGIISRKPRIRILKLIISDTVEIKWDDVDHVFFQYGHMFIDSYGISYKKNGLPGTFYIVSGQANYAEALVYIHKHVPISIIDKKVLKLVEKYSKEAKFKYFRNG